MAPQNVASGFPASSSAFSDDSGAAADGGFGMLRQGGARVRDCGTFDITIDRDGAWFHEGRPIVRPALVRLFARVLERDEGGIFWLSTPAERGRIAVADAPFLAVALTATGQGRDRCLSFRTNLDECVELGPEHALRVEGAEAGEPRPYIHVRDRLEARLTRPVFYELVEFGEEHRVNGEARVGVWSGGCFFDLGPLPEE